MTQENDCMANTSDGTHDTAGDQLLTHVPHGAPDVNPRHDDRGDVLSSSAGSGARPAPEVLPGTENVITKSNQKFHSFLFIRSSWDTVDSSAR